MAAYRRVDDLRWPAGWLPVHRDQLRAQRSVSSMGSLYLLSFYTLSVSVNDGWRCRRHGAVHQEKYAADIDGADVSQWCRSVHWSYWLLSRRWCFRFYLSQQCFILLYFFLSSHVFRTVFSTRQPSSRQYLNKHVCVEDKREYYHNCSVLYCVRQLYTHVYEQYLKLTVRLGLDFH